MTKKRAYSPKCSECRQRTMSLSAIPYTVKVNHDGREYTVRISSLTVPKCTVCGNFVLDREATRQIDLAFRREARLLTPEEIRNGRLALRLDQREFAEWFGVAVSTLSRWENGTQIQQRSMNDFLRAFFDLPAFRAYLRRVKGGLSSSTGERLQVATVEPAPASNTMILPAAEALQPHGMQFYSTMGAS